jgi:hypothetical protein
MVFVLRHPISRLVSCYRYWARAGAAAPASFEAFVDGLVRALADAPQERSANQLAMGRYSDFLPGWLETLPAGAVEVIFFEDLIRDPQEVVTTLCHRVGLDAEFYREYQFGAFNKSHRSALPALAALVAPFDRFRIRISRQTTRMPRVHGALRAAKHRLEDLLEPATTVPVAPATPATETVEFLRAYYEGEGQRVSALVGRSVPWDI